MSIDRRKAYYYRWTGEPKFSGIAVDVHVHTGTGGKELRFISPPERPHSQPGAVLRETAGGFVFRSDGFMPGEWVFKELTIEEFRRWIAKRVGMGEDIASKITTTDDLHEWYRKTFHFPTED